MIQLHTPRRASITSGPIMDPKSPKSGKLVDYTKKLGSTSLHSALARETGMGKRFGGDEDKVIPRHSEKVNRDSILRVMGEASHLAAATSTSKDIPNITFRLRKRSGTDTVTTVADSLFGDDSSSSSSCSEHPQDMNVIRCTKVGPTRSASLDRRSYHCLLDSSTNHSKSVFLPAKSTKNSEDKETTASNVSEHTPTIKCTKMPIRKSKSLRTFNASVAPEDSKKPVVQSNLANRRKMLMQKQNSKRNQSMRMLSSSDKKKDALGASSDHSPSSGSAHGNIKQGIGGRRGQLLRQGSFLSGSRMRLIN